MGEQHPSSDLCGEIIGPDASSLRFLFAGGPFPFGPAAAALLARLPLLLAGPLEPPDFHFCERNAEVIDARQPKKVAQVGR